LTTPSPPPTARWHIDWRPAHTRRALRILLGAIGWALLVPMLLLIAYLIGLVVLAAVLLGRPTVLDEGALVLLLLLALSGTLIWLLGHYVARPRSVAFLVGAILTAVAVAETTWALTSPEGALYLARQVAWGDSRVTDYQLFPARAIANAPPVFHFRQRPAPELLQPITYQSVGQSRQLGFEEFLKATNTTSFIVIKDDTILYEGYFNGYSRDSIVTSFSMAKSFTSALVGIAFDEGYIGSMNDPVVTYLPELRGRGLDDLTIRHLLTMSSGIRYIHDDAVSPLRDLTQFTDDGLSYSYPNLRSQALQLQPDGEPVGTYFNYNNYYPQLLGMILERTTHRPPAEYLQEKIWKPLGMEYPASWSLDSEASGFELMTAGINGRAIDFAKFGRLFLNNGTWNGKQIAPASWVVASTAPDPNDKRPWRSERSENLWPERNGYYKYLWWGTRNPDGSYTYAAHGKRGQRIVVSPSAGVVVVRFGIDMGGVDAWEDVIAEVIARVR
jgi:CubicO group peptidase (beta-lactamase class C family)